MQTFITVQPKKSSGTGNNLEELYVVKIFFTAELFGEVKVVLCAFFLESISPGDSFGC